MEGCVELSHSPPTVTKPISIVKGFGDFPSCSIYRWFSSPCCPTRTDPSSTRPTVQNCPTLPALRVTSSAGGRQEVVKQSAHELPAAVNEFDSVPERVIHIQTPRSGQLVVPPPG